MRQHQCYPRLVVALLLVCLTLLAVGSASAAKADISARHKIVCINIYRSCNQPVYINAASCAEIHTVLVDDGHIAVRCKAA